MLCANRAAIRLCEVLWHSPSVDSISKCYDHHSVQPVMQHHYASLPCVAPGSEVLGRGAHLPSNWHMLMQWCSFSQSRVYSNQSEIQEAMNGQDLAQSKRSCEAKADEASEKRLRLDGCDPALGTVAGLNNFSVPSYEWQHFELSSVARSHCEVVPIYEAESLDELKQSTEATEQNSTGDGDLEEDVALYARKEILLQSVRQLRTWQYTDFGKKMSRSMGTGVEFTLMSYNILAQDLLEDNFYLYNHCNHSVLDWDFRSQNLLAEIQENNPDILCLQELTETHYEEYFHPQLHALGWDSLYKKRTGGKHDGCAIFFKRSLFEMESYTNVEYYKPHIQHLDRDNVGLIAVLKPLGAGASKGTKLCVATTHLLFNPRRGDIKLSQLQLLLAEMDKVAFKGPGENGAPTYHPAILCGDMNSEPKSPLYQFLTGGTLMYDGLMAGNISGQKEGINRGKTICGTDLHLQQLGLSLDCQYADVNAKRMGPAPRRIPHPWETTRDGILRNESSCHLIDFQNPALDIPFRANLESYRDNSSSGFSHQPTSGCLRHQFNFVSAYKHRSPTGEVPVTTHHKKASCIVDYIFYSVRNRNIQGPGTYREGPLHLIGTCRLPTSQEVADLGGLPNAALSSDHLSLIAKFFLNLFPSES